MKSLKNKTQKKDGKTEDTSARELRGREVASMSARVAGIRQSMGHSNESGYRRGPGVHSRATAGGKAE